MVPCSLCGGELEETKRQGLHYRLKPFRKWIECAIKMQKQIGYLDDEYKERVRRFCTNLVDVGISEFLKG